MTLNLRHTRGSKCGKTEKYDSERIAIGRNEENDLRFSVEKDGEVSGNHAMISRIGDAFVLEDFHSTNGTFVNGERISKPTPLKNGDEIEFARGGPKVIFSSPALNATIADTNNTPPAVATITAPPAGSVQLGAAPSTAAAAAAVLGVKCKSPTMMISDALNEARIAGKGRIGNVTAMFMSNLLHEASAHSSKRLRIAMLCITIVFSFVAAGLISSNLLQRGKIEELVIETKKVQKARTELQQERELLRAEGEQLKQELDVQAAELRRLEALIEKLSEGGIVTRVTEEGEVAANLPSVLFQYNDSTLQPGGQKKIAYIASVVLSNAPGRSIIVEGHASFEPGGSEEHNIRLSKERAEAVANALAYSGIPSDNITTEGLGSSLPIASNDTESGRIQNRRVEVIISGEGSGESASVE